MRTLVYRLLKTVFVIALTVSAIGKLSGNPLLSEAFTKLGYPLYMMTILGACYLAGVAGILQPRYGLVREWAYAGFVFALGGSFFSHLLAGQAFATSVPSLVLLAMVITVYWLEKSRPGRAV